MAGVVGYQADALHQLAALNRIARIAVQDLDWRPMLQRIVDTLATEFGWDFVACATIDPGRNEFVCEAVCGRIDSEISVGYRRELGSGVVGACALTGKTIDIADARGNPNVIDTLHGTGSELCVPVVHNDEVLAVLNAESRLAHAFDGQRALLETVADQVAGILHAANLLAQLKQANAALEVLSQNDSLTGIANRRQFDQWLAAALAGCLKSGRSLALMMIDIDFFKSYNDGYGHLAGDACLRDIAGLLQYMLSGTQARLARYGGEEFALVLESVEDHEALALAERLRLAVEARAFEHRFAPDGLITISIGVAAAVVPELPLDSSSMIASADAALYEAKRQGRNQVRIAAAMR